MATEQLHVPHLADSELLQALRRRAAAGDVTDDHAAAVLDGWRSLGITRHALLPLQDRIWALRHNLSAYDAGYVALAEALGCALLTGDMRLARATGVRCAVVPVPR